MTKQVSLFLMTAVLLCAVSTLEIPELLLLVDNTSNDYSTVIFQKNAPSTLANQSPAVSRAVVPTLPAVAFAAIPLKAESSESFTSLPDLLHLFCVQRT
jgi:hypothetical protein